MLKTQTLAFGYNETIKAQVFSRPQKPNVLYRSSVEIGKYEPEMSISRCGYRHFVFPSFNCFPTFVILNFMSTLIHKMGGFRAKFSPGKACDSSGISRVRPQINQTLSHLTSALHFM